MLTYYENGAAKKTFDIVSGHKGKVPTEASEDKEGSNNPIPQGVFSIGAPEAVTPSDDPKDPINDLGPTWISIDTKGYGGRSAIGFHADADGDGQSRGCVTLKNKGDIGEIANLVKGGANMIIVDHGLKENPVAGVCSPDGAASKTGASDDREENIAGIRNNLAKSCFGGPVIAFGFAVPFIFGEKLHETFAPYVSGILMIVFAIWAYLKVGSALLPFGPKDQAAALFNAIGVRFFVVLGVSVFLLAPTTGYTAYRDYIITPILSAGSTIVDKMYQIGVETNPTLARFAEEDGQCTPTPIKGLDAKLTALKDDLECKVCMIQRAYSYPWSYGLFQVGNGKIFTGLLLMLVGIAPFLMFLFTVADVFMVRIGYVSCTLSAYAAAGCFPASRKYAITGLKSLSDGAMVLITSMIAAMISISMLTTVIENLDKGGQGDFAGTVAATPGSIATDTSTPADTGKPQTGPSITPQGPVQNPVPPTLTPGGMAKQASNFQTPTTTYATGPMGANTPNGTYASWYRNTHLRQPPPPQNTGFDTFRETPLAGSTLGDVPVACPMVYANGQCAPLTSGMGRPQEFGLFTRDYGTRIHAGQDYDCPQDYALRPMTQCEVKYHTSGSFICNVLNNGQKTMVTFHYVHLLAPRPFPVNTVIDPSKLVGYCSKVDADAEHLHLEIEICDNLSYSESLARMQAKYPASGVSGGVPFITGGLKNGGSTGRNCYLVHPNFFVKGAMSFTGTEAAGFSAMATNFKNFGVTHEDWMSTIIICIITLLILKIAQRFTSGQGMGIFMKALGQMITGVIQTLGAVVTGGAKAAEALAPVGGMVGGMAAGAAGQILERTGLDKAVNRAAEGVQGAMNNVTQGLSGVMDNIGSGISGFVQQSVQTVQNLPITQRVMEFQQGMRDLAAGITSSDFAQGVARVVMPGVAVLTFATKNVALPVAGFAFREGLMPAAGAAAGKILETGALTVFDPSDEFELRDAGREIGVTLGNMYDARRTAPLSEAPARDAAAPAGEQQRGGLVRVQSDPTDINTSGERSGTPSQTISNYARLGLKEGATWSEIQDAYRKIALQHHPDRHQNQTEQEKLSFRDITAAYNVIKGQRDGFMPREGVGAVSQGPTSDTTRQLSGTTFAAMPRGDTGGGRAAQESSRRDSIADARRDLGSFGYSGSPQSSDESEERASEDNTPSLDSRPKEKENAKPANNIVSARGLRDNNKKPDLRQEGMKRAASVAGDGVSAHEIIAMVGYEADVGAMRKAKEDIISKRTIPSSRR